MRTDPQAEPIHDGASDATSTDPLIEPAGLDPYQAVLLMSFGGPERPEQVMPFLHSVAAGRGIPTQRLHAVAAHYHSRGGRSPINDENRALLAALRTELDRRGLPTPLLWGNRHAAPFLTDALAEADRQGWRRLVAVPTSAYCGYSSCRQYWEDLAGDPGAPERPQVDRIRRYAHHPGFSRTMTRLVLDQIRRLVTDGHDLTPARFRIAYVTHSIPLAMDASSGPSDGDGYQYTGEHRSLAGAITGEVDAVVGHSVSWDLVYCSRSGPPSQPWLEPDIDDHLTALAAAGVDTVLIVPIGFVADHMEVIADLDEQAVATGQALGMTVIRVPTVRADPEFAAGLVDLLLERAALARDEGVRQPCWPSGSAAPVTCSPGCCPAPVRPGLARPSGC